MVLSMRAVTIALLTIAGSARAQSAGPRPLLFGFAVECSKCDAVGIDGRNRRAFGAGPFAIWHYDERPTIADVTKDGPADRAGVRKGDVLVAVDGLSITSDEGGFRFSRLRAGDDVKLTLERSGKPYTIALRLGRLGGGRFGRAGFAGGPFLTHVGGATVEITSDSPVTSTTDANGVTTLRVGTTLIVLKPPTKAP
jgi:membrane-associated protease RseP (regulator of RpoE activity)